MSGGNFSSSVNDTAIGQLRYQRGTFAPVPKLQKPEGPQWDAAQGDEWEKLMREAEGIMGSVPGFLCGGPKKKNLQAALEEQWSPKANAYLSKHGLKVSFSTTVRVQGGYGFEGAYGGGRKRKLFMTFAPI